jgi:hypothetical protein
MLMASAVPLVYGFDGRLTLATGDQPVELGPKVRGI